MKLERSQDQTYTPKETAPVIVYDENTRPNIHIDPQSAGNTLRGLGVSELGISETTIYMDPKNRLRTYGTHYPDWVGRLRFSSITEIRQTKGDVIRLSTVMKGVSRTAEEMNHTFVHEAEHCAQQERRDHKITEGHIAIWGLTLASAVIGNRLSKRKITRVAGALVGAVIGHTAGYRIAPHERQAHLRARQVTSTAIYTTQ